MSVKTEIATRPSTSARAATSLARLKSFLTPLNLHFAGIALLALVNLYLLIHLVFVWETAHSQNADAVAQQRIELKTAQIAALPLKGLDGKLAESTSEADAFYARRLPYATSLILTELGGLAKKENVKLSRVNYTYTPVAGDVSLTEVHIDASLAGDYRPLVQLINSLERDKTFFLITGVTLTGQQSGTVNLRLRLTTYLRQPQGDEKSEPLVGATLDENGKPAPEGGSAQ